MLCYKQSGCLAGSVVITVSGILNKVSVIMKWLILQEFECNTFWVEQESKNIDFSPERLSDGCIVGKRCWVKSCIH